MADRQMELTPHFQPGLGKETPHAVQTLLKLIQLKGTLGRSLSTGLS